MQILAILPVLTIIAIGCLIASLIVLYEFSKVLKLESDDEEDD
jgi:hypothetical protein